MLGMHACPYHSGCEDIAVRQISTLTTLLPLGPQEVADDWQLPIPDSDDTILGGAETHGYTPSLGARNNRLLVRSSRFKVLGWGSSSFGQLLEAKDSPLGSSKGAEQIG